LTVKIFDISLNKVNSNYLDMSTTKGATCTVTDIFDWLIDWQCYYTKSDTMRFKCVAFSVDNASVNMGKKLN